jgi:outer membrane receptor for ferrienterochelin and colicins
MNATADTGICWKHARPTKSPALVLVALLVTGSAFAQTVDHAAFEALFGEPVTTSVTGSPQRASQVAATMVIVTAEDIRRSGARDLPSVLRLVPGLDTMQTTRDHWDVSIRGYNEPFSPRLLVLVDGRQVYADYYGFTPWSTIPVELAAIRQIEVVKGPNSALFGFNAVGGVVNIVTYGPLDQEPGQLSLAVSSQDRTGASLVTGFHPVENLGLRLSASHRDGDDFSTDLDPTNAGIRRGNERSAANLALAWQATGNLQLGLEATWSRAEEPVMAPLYRLAHDDYETSSVKGYLTADTRIGLLRATAYTNHIEAEASVGSDPQPGLTPDNTVTVAQLESITKLARNHTLRLSAEYRDNAMDTTRVSGGEVGYQVAAAAAMWEWRLTPALALTTALRLDRWDLERKGTVPAGYPLDNSDWNRSDTEVSFNGGLVWQVSDDDTLRFLVGRGIQVPSLLALGGLLIPLPGDQFATGVPDLEPTVVSSYEINWDRNLPSLDGRLRASLYGGRSRHITANAGGARPADGLLGLPVNVGNSRTVGVELALDARLADHWRWGISYTGQVVNDDFDPGLPPEIILLDYEETTPRHFLRGKLGWALGTWEVDGFLGYRSRFRSFRRLPAPPSAGELHTIDGFFTLDGRVAWRAGRRVTLALSGQNLLRSEQTQTPGPDVERIIHATITFDLGADREAHP